MCSYEVVKIIYEKILDQIGPKKSAIPQSTYTLYFPLVCVCVCVCVCRVPIVLVGNKTDLHMQRYGCV